MRPYYEADGITVKCWSGSPPCQEQAEGGFNGLCTAHHAKYRALCGVKEWSEDDPQLRLAPDVRAPAQGGVDRGGRR